METCYILEVPKKEMLQLTDMLRFDVAYQVEDEGDNYKIYCVRFTPERWKSFGFIPTVIAKIRITDKETREFIIASNGFREGLRFAQNIIPDVSLVEGSIGRK